MTHDVHQFDSNELLRNVFVLKWNRCEYECEWLFESEPHPLPWGGWDRLQPTHDPLSGIKWYMMAGWVYLCSAECFLANKMQGIKRISDLLTTAQCVLAVPSILAHNLLATHLDVSFQIRGHYCLTSHLLSAAPQTAVLAPYLSAPLVFNDIFFLSRTIEGIHRSLHLEKFDFCLSEWGRRFLVWP